MPVIKPSQIKRFPSLLVYGKNGAGKSHLMGTVLEVPEMMPALIIDADGGGCVTLQNLPGADALDVFDLARTKPVQVQLPEIISAAKQGKYSTIILDSASEFMDRLYIELVGNNKQDFKYWNALFRITRETVLTLQTLCNCFVSTAYHRIEKDEDGGTIIDIFPSISGREFPKFYNNLHNVLAMLRTETIKNAQGVKVNRILGTIPDSVEAVRDRFGKLGNLVNPTMATIWEKIGGGMAKVPQ